MMRRSRTVPEGFIVLLLVVYIFLVGGGSSIVFVDVGHWQVAFLTVTVSRGAVVCYTSFMKGFSTVCVVYGCT